MAMKHWGRNHDVLGNHPDLPHPQPPETVAMNPTKHVGDRTTRITKPEAAWATRGNQHQPAVNGGSTGSQQSQTQSGSAKRVSTNRAGTSV